jgi:hypothetical protein
MLHQIILEEGNNLLRLPLGHLQILDSFKVKDHLNQAGINHHRVHKHHRLGDSVEIMARALIVKVSKVLFVLKRSKFIRFNLLVIIFVAGGGGSNFGGDRGGGGSFGGDRGGGNSGGFR